MKLPSSYSACVDVSTSRDAELTKVARSILAAAQREWGDGFVIEPNAEGIHPALLYTETHFALAAVLLSLCVMDRPLLDLAASRLRLWDEAKGPMTFFNAMAVCLSTIVFQRSGLKHAPLAEILAALVARAREHRHVGYKQWCGNNAYLQQVAVDTLLLPLARQEEVTQERANLLLAEFRRYRTSEGFFWDLPRKGKRQEPLCPPTYIMKMLFLAGICHELHPSEEFADLFRQGMVSALPLLTTEGHFSYFGRTDNSPFEAGLTIFNLRKANRMVPAKRAEYEEAAARAEHYYATFPRTSNGMMQCNRFADATSPAELDWARDEYAYVGQYSLSSCAYALLGRYWFPHPAESTPSMHAPAESAVSSEDLGLARLTNARSEIVVRTGSQMTGWDRRYLGPTILRYRVNGQLLIGCISRTVSTDIVVAGDRQSTRIGRVLDLFRHRFVNGIEQLDGTTVGFLPILRRGFVDYLPYVPLAEKVSPSHLRIRYRMAMLHARGYRPCLIDALELVHNNMRVLGPRQYSRPPMSFVDSIEMCRDIYLEKECCRIEDRVSGNLRRKKLLFSVRYLPGASVKLRGLTKTRSAIGWGSNGRQTIDVYEGLAVSGEIRYGCDIEIADRLAR